LEQSVPAPSCSSRYRAFLNSPAIGWRVGWVEKGGEIRIFALNVDVLKPEHLKTRIEIGKAVLRELGAL
jgi:beta-lactamase class D